jgi:TPR repeat protein
LTTAAKPPDQTSDSDASPDAGEAPAKGVAAVAPQSASPEAHDATPKEPPAVTTAPTPKSVASKPSPVPAAPPASFEDKLVSDGERYLYGRGVPEDCERAQRNLQIGARQSNARAQTLLGAMYATGHCVNRDLPTAYRWFAKALHGDPGNSRVQRDLEVLWKQMTPEERLLAMKSQ